MGQGKEEVKRFKGVKNADQICDGTVPRIMDSSGLKLKAIVVSGEDNGQAS